MKVTHYRDVPSQPVEGTEGVRVRWVVGPEDRPPHFYIRVFEIAPGASTPHHRHPWEHEVFVLRGEGFFDYEDESHPIREGDVVFVEGQALHRFRNSSSRPLEIICVIPKEGAG